MILREVLSVLSKQSPYAVSTERDQSISVQLDEIKKYLYIKTDIETDFKKALTSLSPSDKKIIFLCGSSGDGKSEILTKYCKKFSQIANFHLDATHSFKPNESAIETLDTLFQDFTEGTKPLVVGINIGMLGNYVEEGSHEQVKESIKSFLNEDKTENEYVYLNFEKYPKFELQQDGHSSKFAKQLLQRICAAEDNIIRQYYDKELLSPHKDKRLCANYELLSINEVQDVIVDLLFKARLIKDQFLTTRALLDFIFHLLAGPGYLQDNLFVDCDNELVSKISDFDPANIRSKTVDKFILSHSLKLTDDKFEQYLIDLTAKGIRKGQKTETYLRLFYILRNADFSNNYHIDFKADFHEQLIDRYSTVWHLHTAYEGLPEQRSAIKSFYKETVISAIHKYNNRNAPYLNKGEFFICERNGYQLAAHIELKVDIKNISSSMEQHVSQFYMFFKIDDETLTMPANINLLHLMQRIVDGYRPNKHDKNTVVVLDEIVDKISEVANNAKTLYILKKNQRIKITNDGDDLEVSGL